MWQFFVRVTLQRLPQKNDRLGPVCTVIDHYVDSGVGEWLIPRSESCQLSPPVPPSHLELLPWWTNLVVLSSLLAQLIS